MTHLEKIQQYAEATGITVQEIDQIDGADENEKYGSATIYREGEAEIDLLLERMDDGRLKIAICPDVEAVMQVTDPLTDNPIHQSLPFEPSDSDCDQMNDWAWDNAIHDMII